MSNVEKPNHYAGKNFTCIDAMLEAFGKDEVMTFCKLNAFKYLWRAENKNGEEDILKAQQYLKFYTNLQSNKNIYE